MTATVKQWSNRTNKEANDEEMFDAIRQIIPAHIGGVLCFLAIVDVTNLNSGATIDTDSSDTKRVFII